MLKHATLGAAALILASTALARAEVDAPTIWSDWQGIYARMGADLSAASEDYAGGTLTLEGVTVATTSAGDRSETSLGTLTMIEQPDGTVRIELPAEVKVTTTGVAGDLEQTQDMTLTHEGLDIVASETDGIRTYVMAADSLTLAMTQQVSVPEGSDVEPEGEMPPTDITVTLTDVASTYRSGMGGDAEAFAQEATVATIAIDVDVRSESDPLTVAQRLQSVALDVTGNYGPVPTEPVETFLAGGIQYEATVSHAGSTLALDGSNAETEGGDPAQTYGLDGTSEAGRMTIGLGDGQLSYAVNSTRPALTIEASQLPAPVAISMADAAWARSMVRRKAGRRFMVKVQMAVTRATWQHRRSVQGTVSVNRPPWPRPRVVIRHCFSWRLSP